MKVPFSLLKLYARAKFLSFAQKTHMRVIISYHSFALPIRDYTLINIYAVARRRNGDYYVISK